MSTNAASGTETINSTVLPAQQQRSAHDELSRQLYGMLDATMRETWLPMGFRVLVVQNFPTMRKLLGRKRIAYEKLDLHVVQLLEEAEPYKVFAKRSASLVALRTLKAEIDSVRLAA